MPRPYSEDLRWRAIWVKEILGFQVDEVAAALWMSKKNYRTLCFKSFKFWRRQSRNYWKTSKQCGNASARGIFDYGGSAWTSRENAIRNCIQHVRSNWIRISFSKDFLLFATKPFQSKKVCLIFSSALEVSYSFWNKQAPAFFPKSAEQDCSPKVWRGKSSLPVECLCFGFRNVCVHRWERVCKY